jgi:NFU1 iron-sulfur cluster scaffold homolog, mitochondrial
MPTVIRAIQGTILFVPKTRLTKYAGGGHWISIARWIHQGQRLPSMLSSNSRIRPTLKPLHQPSTVLRLASVGGSRSIFIQTENTPNPDALKFLPNHPILPAGLSSPFIEYLTPRSTLSSPYPSPLAAKLMNIDGITSVFYGTDPKTGTDSITVTKASDVNWAYIKPEVFSLITEAMTSGQQIVNVSDSKLSELEHGRNEEDSLSYNEDDSEVVGMIKELLETRIRPTIQEDGGDIEFRGFKGGNVLLKLRGACRTCDSSTMTLKNGIEGMLMHYVSAVSRSASMITDRLYADRGSERRRASSGSRRGNCNAGICEVRGEAEAAAEWYKSNRTHSWKK